MNKKAFVFIDGGNFYFKLKELTSKLNGKFSLIDFNFRKFAEWLVKPKANRMVFQVLPTMLDYCDRKK